MSASEWGQIFYPNFYQRSVEQQVLWPDFPQLLKFWKFDPQYLVIKIQQIVSYYINFKFFIQFWPFFTIFPTFSLKNPKIPKNDLVTLATSWDPLPLYFKSQSIKENGDLNSSTKLGQRRRLLCSCFLLSRTVLSPYLWTGWLAALSLKSKELDSRMYTLHSVQNVFLLLCMK